MGTGSINLEYGLTGGERGVIFLALDNDDDSDSDSDSD